MTALELIVGARDRRDLVAIDAFLSLYSVVPLSDGIATRAYGLLKTYAKSHGLHVFDSLIAARPVPPRVGIGDFDVSSFWSAAFSSQISE